MSGLGTTVDPAGAIGSVTHAPPPNPEIIPDNPGQIAQSTATQTLDQLLRGNWIYDSTFTVSTNMPAGTIVYSKPVHPLSWNWPNKKVATMFNLWTGSGSIRYRPLATAWYGGSIRVGFLPPNISLAGVRELPLEVLTSYPNRDIDPKNTDWVDFRAPDQREIAYHYMAPFDPSNKQNFGGWIVFYVAGKLVTQSPEFTTIQFVVESAGNFEYDQPNPQALSDVPLRSDPLGWTDSVPLDMQSLCDSRDSGDMIIQVLPKAINSLPYPGVECSAVSAPYTSGAAIPELYIHDAVKKLKNSQGGANSAAVFVGGSIADSFVGSGFIPHFNNAKKKDEAFVANIVAGADYEEYHRGDLSYNQDSDAIYIAGTRKSMKAAGIVFPESRMVLSNDADATNPLDVQNNAKASEYFRIRPQADGESIIVFTNPPNRNYSAQTIQQSVNIQNYPGDAFNQTDSYLYNLVNKSGTPLITIRLNPNGVFTTTAADSPVVYPTGGMRLRFVGLLPISSPLPPLSALAREARRAGRRLAMRYSAIDAKLTAEEFHTY